jgi:membrane fusion protein (multidrug efflux system)
MSTPKRFLVVVIILLIVLGALFGWRFFQISQMAAMFSQPQPPTPVAATEAETVSWVPAITSVGSLRAINGVRIANEVPGVVEQILFESGQRVEQGQTLVRIDAATDEAALNTLRAEARLAETEFQRVSELIKKRAVSQAEFDAAQAQREAAAARVKQQEAQLAKKVLRAPFAGIVGLRQVDLGEYLTAGSPVVEINMLDPIFVEYTVGEKELPLVAVGYQVELFIAAAPEETFTGTVSAINSSVNVETRTVRVRATLANPEHRLKPGMFATVRTLQPSPRELVAVPRTAISYNTYGDFVFVLKENDEGQLVTERRSVTTGDARNGMVEIKSGLRAGEQVVKTGLLRLRAGEPVAVVAANTIDTADARAEQSAGEEVVE